MSEEKPFFIGWESKPAPVISAFTRKATLGLLAVSFIVAGLVTAMQQTVSSGRFEFGNVKDFSGILIKSPAPMLVSDTEIDGEKIFYLVAPLKNGFSAELAEKHHLQQVSLKGTLIGDDMEAMIEVQEDTIVSKGTAANPLEESGGTLVTIQGEIVDSKCHLGVMNPGRFKPHRACAIQCLSGGIPPILVAQTAEGVLANYLIVGLDGKAINEDILEYAAEPVEVSGTLKTIGDRLVLYIDPETIQRL